MDNYDDNDNGRPSSWQRLPGCDGWPAAGRGSPNCGHVCRSESAVHSASNTGPTCGPTRRAQVRALGHGLPGPAAGNSSRYRRAGKRVAVGRNQLGRTSHMVQAEPGSGPLAGSGLGRGLKTVGRYTGGGRDGGSRPGAGGGAGIVFRVTESRSAAVVC